MNRVDVINLLIEKNNYKSYLEIGVQNGYSFNNVKCEMKIGIDPDSNSAATFKMTSDQFFKDKCISRFDIIFIDGLHHSDQVLKDINNSFAYLNKNGIVVVHDCLPKEEIHQIVPRVSKIWNGDVWKAMIMLKRIGCYKFNVIDTDYGIGLVELTETIKDFSISNEEMTFINYQNNRDKWLNVITPKEFKELYIDVPSK